MTTDYGFPNWLQYLLDVCRPQWREIGLKTDHPRALALLDSFYAEDDQRMMAGVKSYLKQKSDGFIPFPGELDKHLPAVPDVDMRPSRAFHVWHKLEVAAKWPICQVCGEHTHSIVNCPLCADMRDEAVRTAAQIANKDWLQVVQS